MLTWKIVKVSKGLVLYIYIYYSIEQAKGKRTSVMPLNSMNIPVE